MSNSLPPDSELPINSPDDHEDPKLELPKKIVDLLNIVPEPQRAKLISSLQEEIGVVVQEVSQEVSMRHYSGPIPHPDTLRGMEEVVPGSASQIIQMAVDQSTHRRQLETTVVNSQTKQSGNGQIFGFIIAMVIILISGFLIYTGHDTAGSILGTVDIIGLVSIFVIGNANNKKTWIKRKRRTEKTKQIINNNFGLTIYNFSIEHFLTTHIFLDLLQLDIHSSSLFPINSRLGRFISAFPSF